VNNLIANVPIRIETIISIIKNINEQGAPKEWSTYSKFPKVLQKMLKIWLPTVLTFSSSSGEKAA
jgi:hypothetical protein